MLTRQEAKDKIQAAIKKSEEAGPDQVRALLRHLSLNNLFFLLTNVLRRKDADNDFVYDRCAEVQAEPDGCMDLWARFHFKSSIITFAKTIQDVLINPELTIGIFSHTRPIAKAFLRQIKTEFEQNNRLYWIFPDIVIQEPARNAPKWSEDEGIIPVKRKGNPKESTVEAWGLVDGQPIGRHYNIRVYDDVVTQDSVSTPEQIQKTNQAWELSLNLGTLTDDRKRVVGTYYHFNDTYHEIERRGTLKLRKYPATDDGTLYGTPHLITKEKLEELRRDMGPYVFSCQLLLNPVADDAQGFKEEWLKWWDVESYKGMNIYVLCDPASSKKRDSDYTVFFIVGLGADRNYYVIDIIRDRMNLTERTNVLFDLHQTYLPYQIGYEKYGMQADIEHIKYVQDKTNYRFPITELGGSMPKNDRIRRLVPKFESGIVYLPRTCRKMYLDGKTYDNTDIFKNDEFLAFPVSRHDDMLDCLSRIEDEDILKIFPDVSSKTKRRNRPGGMAV